MTQLFGVKFRNPALLSPASAAEATEMFPALRAASLGPMQALLTE